MSTPNEPNCLPDKHGVVAILQDEVGRYLFIRRGLKLKRAPGWWCFVGGEVDPGEAHSEAIVREVQEEVGLVVRALDKVHESISPNGEYRLHWLRVELSHAPQTIVPHPDEVEEARWLTAEDGLKLEPILPGLKAWLEKRR
ncbi:MAG TPA: NUDIX hydrolase [Planctomycetota bacterium]|nr:NUDIX hydrolase [Planctomycetota bacterium]